MKPEEVLALTDKELRIKAAELMGFTEIAAGAFDDLWGYCPRMTKGTESEQRSPTTPTISRRRGSLNQRIDDGNMGRPSWRF